MTNVMFKKGLVLLMAVCMVFSAVAIAKEQSSDRDVKNDRMRQMDKGQKNKQCDITGRFDSLQSVEAILGMDIQNTKDETLGSIEEIVLDDTQKSIAYVILSADGKLYQVPWKAFDVGMKTYTLDITADNLKQSPSVTSVRDSQLSDSKRNQETQDYYMKQITAVEDKNIGERAADWVKEKSTNLMGKDEKTTLYTCNDLIGYDVQNMQDKDIGELEDIVFDVRDGNLAYGLISFGGYWGIGGDISAVPWKSIQLQHQQETIKLDADEETLKSCVLPEKDLHRLSEPKFARQLHERYHQQPYWLGRGYMDPAGHPQADQYADWDPDSSYDVNNVQSINGTIKKIGSYSRNTEKGAPIGLKLTIRTDDDQTKIVYAGPQMTYQQQMKVKLEKGDKVAIRGSRATIDQKNVILASEIKKDGQTYIIRDDKGKSLWKKDSDADYDKMNHRRDHDKMNHDKNYEKIHHDKDYEKMNRDKDQPNTKKKKSEY